MKFNTRYFLCAYILLITTLAHGQRRDIEMNTALIIVDIQNDYFKGGAMPLVNPEKASANAKWILENFRKRNFPVIHIQHIANRPEATFFISETKGVEIHSDVTPIEKEKVIVKHFPNSFRDTELLDYLKAKQINKLVICGMMTHMCIDATTRAAKDFGFDCIVVSDACATKNLEYNGIKVMVHQVQSSFLAALNHFYARVITTKQILKEIKLR